MCCACLHDAVVGPETYGHDGDNGPQHIPFKKNGFVIYTIYYIVTFTFENPFPV